MESRTFTFHENLDRSFVVRGSSDRNFGLVFAIAFLAVGVWPLCYGAQMRIWALVIAGGFLMLAILRPAVLHPLNRLWTHFGLLLGRMMNPVMTGVLFFVVFTPFGLLTQLLRKDPLRLTLISEAETYWIKRQPPGPKPETMSKQF
jgi:hypothetical protein